MARPNPYLETTGTDPRQSTKAKAEAMVRRATDQIYDEFSGQLTGTVVVGDWDASGGAFPAGATRGDAYFVNGAGTVDSQGFAVGDWLVALVDDPSATTYAGNWVRGDYSQVDRASRYRRKTAVQVLADTLWTYTDGQPFSVVEGQTLVAEAQGFAYEVAASDATDHHVVTSRPTTPVKLYASALPDGSMAAASWGAEIVADRDDAPAAECGVDIIHAITAAGYDVTLGGWMNAEKLLVLTSQKIVGRGQRRTGINFSATMEFGLRLMGSGATVQSLGIYSDFSVDYLVDIGDGTQGSAFGFDAKISDCRLEGGGVRTLRAMENSNGYAEFSIISQAGAREEGSPGSVTDHDRHTLEIRSIFRMTGCHVSSATGCTILLTGSDATEECRLEFNGGRIQTGYDGLLKVVAYDHNYKANAVLQNVYLENPGLLEGGITANNNVVSSLVAQGPGALIEVDLYQKAFGREADYVAQGLDGGQVYVRGMAPTIFQDVNATLDQGGFAEVAKAETTPYDVDIYVPDPGFLIENGGTIYSPKFDQCPFTTAGAFDASMYNEVSDSARVPGTVRFGGVPAVRSTSNGSNEFDTTDWVSFIQCPAIVGRLGIDFDGRSLVSILADGTTIALPDFFDNGCTSDVSTTAGEYLTAGSALKLTGDGVSTPSAYGFSFEIRPDMVGHFFMITTKFACKQVGGTFGDAGTLRSRLRVSGAGDPATEVVPVAGESRRTDFTIPGGVDGSMTGWATAAHMFFAKEAGSLLFTHYFDGQTVAIDDICLVDNVTLWALPSADGGTFI
ncbi:hypothetical protein [Chachezhania sediminis]|uniref:hypothetical protein n=1 Tax=Chachezhania sediminis TaxID=2599291 RepID=UPI00131C881D|nr:hypothetical protein [Chachezhania sediminis]